jgi:hypothetical protein
MEKKTIGKIWEKHDTVCHLRARICEQIYFGYKNEQKCKVCSFHFSRQMLHSFGGGSPDKKCASTAQAAEAQGNTCTPFPLTCAKQPPRHLLYADFLAGASGYMPFTIEYKSTPPIAIAEPAIPMGVIGVLNASAAATITTTRLTVLPTDCKKKKMLSVQINIRVHDSTCVWCVCVWGGWGVRAA